MLKFGLCASQTGCVLSLYEAVLYSPNRDTQVKLKHLDNVRISTPLSSRTDKVGSVTRKQHTAYDIWAIDPRTSESEDTEHGYVGIGEELRTISVLLPRAKRSGKLYLGKFCINL